MFRNLKNKTKIFQLKKKSIFFSNYVVNKVNPLLTLLPIKKFFASRHNGLCSLFLGINRKLCTMPCQMDA